MLNNDTDSSESEGTRLKAEWLALTAVREILSIAKRATPRYLDALPVGAALAPNLLGDGSILASEIEDRSVKEFLQRAAAETKLQSVPVKALDLVNLEIQRLENYLSTDIDKRDQLRNKCSALYAVKDRLEQKRRTENEIIISDVFKPDVNVLSSPLETGRQGILSLAHNRTLRIRMLHPNVPEAITGADVVYELYDPDRESIRLSFLQYKIWDGDSLLFSRSGNLENQIAKLDAFVCKRGLCNAPQTDAPSFRMPHCAAFLRPTDQLQNPADPRSTGEHIPICMISNVVKLTAAENKVLRKTDVNAMSVSQKVFDEMFTRKMIGSAGRSRSEVESLYRDCKLFSASDRIYLHVQDYWVPPELAA